MDRTLAGSPARRLSAFPLTPLRDDALDERALASLVERLVAAGVDEVAVLGSTGSYAYLSREERRRAVQVAVEHAAGVPVMAGIGALRTSHVQALADDAQDAGASAVLLAPLTYQQHTADDVLGLFRDVTRGLSVPVVVYDNPGTTHFTFTDELYGRISELPRVASIKIPGTTADPAAAATRVEQIREHVPAHVGIGISGDPFAAHGSLRVLAAVAEEIGLVQRPCLPLPLLGLDPSARAQVTAALRTLGVL